MTTPRPVLSLMPRSPDEIAAAAHAVQANVVALRVAWCKAAGADPSRHDILTPSPGAVRRFRELLLDREVVRSYTTEELTLRLRQVWGEFCALCWHFIYVDPQQPISFDPLPTNQRFRPGGQIHRKLAEVQYNLWRMKHEQRARHDQDARHDPEFLKEHEIALTRPVMVYGQSVLYCNDADLLCCACEHAGMLAALRWSQDQRWEWEAPGIMEVTLDPVQ